MKKLTLIILALTLALSFSLVAHGEEQRDVSFENSLAADLKALGLFSGVSENNFDLERAPSRTEVLIMLIRVLGEEKAALEGEYTHPFTDVPAWADKYVGYAYETGLTKGVSATKFGNDTASAATYLTFMLRALGYSDANGDFKWDAPEPLASGLGLLPACVDTENFLRADIVTVSYAALSVELKHSTKLLYEKLIEKEAFTADVFGKSYSAAKITDKENESKAVLTAEQIYEKCSSAVFYIEIQEEDGKAISSGSGFFIDESGIAITNWHVMNGAKKAEITLAGSGAKYDVSGVYYYSVEHDVAIIQVNGSGFNTLKINPLPVKGASSVYAIGSPKGLQNTISQGIISNTRRIVDGETYIQTTAAISNGSSGGVLLNAYGEAIGITSASYTDGQNLNFARPVTYVAPAKTDVATPIAEVNWNYVRYSLREDKYTVKVGETLVFEYDMYIYTTDGEYPVCKVECDVPDVVAATVKFDETFIYLAGIAPGTVNITLSDDRSNSSVTFPVTVTEGEGEFTPYVDYIVSTEDISVYKGAEKQIFVKAIGVGMESPSEITVKVDKTTVVKASVAEEEGKDYFTVNIKGTGSGNANLTFANGDTDATCTIPVTSGDIYDASFEKLSAHIKENGKLYEAEDEEDNHYYFEKASPDGRTVVLILYYPEDDAICVRIATTAGILVDLMLLRGGEVVYCIEMAQVNAYGMCEINPRTFGDGKNDNIRFEKYVGSSVYREALEQASPMMLAAVILSLEGWTAELVPGMNASDFGFIVFDVATYDAEATK